MDRENIWSSLRGEHTPPSLHHLTGKFSNSRGNSLFYIALFPRTANPAVGGDDNRKSNCSQAPKPLRGVVLFIHAIGDHCRRYYYFYEQLCERGFGVIAYDLLSHGNSDSCPHGIRAHVRRFRYFIDDTNAFIDFARHKLYPKVLPHPRSAAGTSSPPLILSGVSYGALVALHTALSGAHKIDGIFLSGPSICVEWTMALRIQKLFVTPLSLLIPKMRIVPATNRDWLCRDPGFFEDFDNDPLTTWEPLTAKMGEQSLRAMLALKNDSRIVQPQSEFCSIPILFLMGSEDRVANVGEAKEFFDRLANADKEFHLLRGLYHCLLEDPEGDDVMNYILQWLEKRFPERKHIPQVKLLDLIDMSTLVSAGGKASAGAMIVEAGTTNKTDRLITLLQ